MHTRLPALRTQPCRRCCVELWQMAACTAKDLSRISGYSRRRRGRRPWAALHVWHHELKNPRKVDGRNDQQAGSYLGTGYMDEDIEEFLVSNDLVFSKSASKEALCADVAGLLAEGKWSAGSAAGWSWARALAPAVFRR